MQRLCFAMTPRWDVCRLFSILSLIANVSAAPALPGSDLMKAQAEPGTGQVIITEAGKPVLRYVYHTVEPGDVLERVQPDNRKYARARSDYIHPLYGLDGQELTKDWSPDHPHHRGVYWAWPEVMFRGQLGDLHALQRVFARPTGKCVLASGPLVAQIDAENQWLWDDQVPIVRERAIIRAHRAGPTGRWIDLELSFVALQEEVTIARRGTDKYGGLNVRFAAVQNQEITTHTQPATSDPRRSWADLSGVFPEASATTGMTILQSMSNPRYPGDWVKFPELNWLQPTFPAAGERYPLRQTEPLVLRFRLWIHAGGTPSEQACIEQWDAFQRLSGAP